MNKIHYPVRNPIFVMLKRKLIFLLVVSGFGQEALKPGMAKKIVSRNSQNDSIKYRRLEMKFENLQKMYLKETEEKNKRIKKLKEELQVLKMKNPGFRYLKFKKTGNALNYSGDKILAPLRISNCTKNLITINVHDYYEYGLIKKIKYGQIVNGSQLIKGEFTKSTQFEEVVCNNSTNVYRWNEIQIKPESVINCEESSFRYFIPGDTLFTKVILENKKVSYNEFPVRKYENIIIEWIDDVEYRIRENGVILHQAGLDYNTNVIDIDYQLIDESGVKYFIIVTPRKLSADIILFWKKENDWYRLIRNTFSPLNTICEN